MRSKNGLWQTKLSNNSFKRRFKMIIWDINTFKSKMETILALLIYRNHFDGWNLQWVIDHSLDIQDTR